MSDVGEKRCPLCTEEMDLTDLQLKPCKCGFEICVYCWNHVMDMADKETEGLCPACRTPYDKEKIAGMEATCRRVVAEISSARKLKSQKAKPKLNEGRKHFSDVRVIRRNLVHVMGLPSYLADEDVLGRRDYFGQYGKVLKVTLSRTAGGAIQYNPNNTCSVYITYSKEEEAVRCIQSVHCYILDGLTLRACFGTTKYCHTWLRNMPCNNPDCLYLHTIASEEDSFTKDEIVSAYTRSDYGLRAIFSQRALKFLFPQKERVKIYQKEHNNERERLAKEACYDQSKAPQITGATNNMQCSSGNFLPPPVDEISSSTVTAYSKVVSRIPSSNTVNHMKAPPPESIVLPAAASWGSRSSNEIQPNATFACSDRPAGQYPKGHNSSTGVSCGVASAAPLSKSQTDRKNKPLVTEGGHTLHPNVTVEALECSKKYSINDCQAVTPRAHALVVQNSVPAAVTSRKASSFSSAFEEDDRCTGIRQSNPCSVDNRASSASDEDGNVAANRKLQSLCSGLSSMGIGGQCKGSHITESSDSFASHPLFKSSNYHGSQQSYPENAMGSLTFEAPRAKSKAESFYDPRKPSQGVSELKIQLPDTSGSAGEELLSLAEKSVNTSAFNRPSQWSHASNSLNISNHSVGHSQRIANASFTSDPSSEDHGNTHTEVNEPLPPFTSGNSLLSNRFTEQKNYTNWNLFSGSERADCLGVTDVDASNFENMGESNIISNILSMMDFDDRDTNSREAQSNKQSKFSFARQESLENEVSGFSPFFNIGHGKYTSAPQAQETQDIYFDEFRSGLSREQPYTISTSNSILSDNISASRAQVSAPPGFSVQSKTPPPGFYAKERVDLTYDTSFVNHSLGNSSLMRNQYHVQPTAKLGSVEDFEFIDPAIMAVGRGRLPNGTDSTGINQRSHFSSQLAAFKNDPRFQLLMQQPMLEQQSIRYFDNTGDRLFPLTDVYNTPSKFGTKSPYAQMSILSRNAQISNGWEGWNGVQSGNSMVADLLGNDRLGSEYFPGHENLNYQMHNSSSLYSGAFEM